MEIHTRGYHPKIEAMRRGQEMRQLIREEQDRRHQRKIDNHSHFEAALSKLIEVDPNWEAWYDDSTNIPDYITWTEAFPLIVRIEERIREVSGIVFRWERKKIYLYTYKITRPKLKGKGRMTVTILEWLTKQEFTDWWLQYRKPEYKATVIFSNHPGWRK